MKRKYDKPTMMVYNLKISKFLCGSPGDKRLYLPRKQQEEPNDYYDDVEFE